jgi:Protein of unknown function (DUF1302)
MGTSVPAVGGARRGGGALATALVALALVLSLGSRASAADLSATSGNSLNVTGSVAAVLPATASVSSVLPTTVADSSVLPDAASGPPVESWLHGYHVSGFLSQTWGMWQNPSGLRGFTKSRNSLATSRTWLQVDQNLRINHNNNLFMRLWFVYEPPYAFNSANGVGKYANEFYNQYTVRDAWWENKTGPLTTYIGNQIVVWGQSLAFRVGDIVNPHDTTWAFGFANLEQSRIPQWMIHPILNLPEMGPLSSNFLEGILLPRLQPMWNSCDYADHRYDGECNVNAGSVNNGFPAGVAFDPAGRFGAHFINHYFPSNNALTPGRPLLGPHGDPLQFNKFLFSPIANEFYYCKNLGSATQPFNPVPAALQRNCNLSAGNGEAVDVGQWKVPATTLENWEEGLRFHTLIGSSEFTAFYYYTFNLYPNTFWQQYTNQFRAKFAPIQTVGVTWDAPLPVPGFLGEYLPLVGRAEGTYTNHQGVSSWDVVGHPAGVRYDDSVNWMLAVDVDQAYAPWLTKTGNLSANIEVMDHIAMDSNGSMTEQSAPWTGGGGEPEGSVKNNVSALFNIGTSWLWNDIQPSWTMVFSPKGRTFLLFPAVVLNPPWTKKYFVKFQAIEILSGDISSIQAGGLLKGQSLLTAQLQYNFNLL